MGDIEWYDRLASVPGVGFEGHPDVDRRALPQYNVKPTVNTFEFDGKTHRSLSWKTRDGSTSQSPAAAWASSDLDSLEGDQVIRRMYQAVELPGTVSDYHFAMLGTYQLLWARRNREPELLPELERIMLLDISLVEAQSASIAFEVQGETTMPSVPAFHHLVSLYEREGFFHEALDIAKRAVKAGQSSADEERLIEQIAQLEAEDQL
jgi:hypothetical protein